MTESTDEPMLSAISHVIASQTTTTPRKVDSPSKKGVAPANLLRHRAQATTALSQRSLTISTASDDDAMFGDYSSSTSSSTRSRRSTFDFSATESSSSSRAASLSRGDSDADGCASDAGCKERDEDSSESSAQRLPKRPRGTCPSESEGVRIVVLRC